jgi:hypothetical protein
MPNGSGTKDLCELRQQRITFRMRSPGQQTLQGPEYVGAGFSAKKASRLDGILVHKSDELTGFSAEKCRSEGCCVYSDGFLRTASSSGVSGGSWASVLSITRFPFITAAQTATKIITTTNRPLMSSDNTRLFAQAPSTNRTGPKMRSSCPSLLACRNASTHRFEEA